ncbi:BolA/IbaG family iron-sulfur metabolism protein [Marilutibacter spongiae]|uniref:BolA family transcriptional regulator n=1 Tax=Marilutibacter spongiae TaxID=2025720 RepID=A0A7W3TP93_9GAMM|nr:BolA family transcriptional regulator [Lysobacter spongiae]
MNGGPLPREARVAAIRAALERALSPLELQVVDDSARHAGHAGARDGRGHFNVDVVSAAFEGMPPLARHRAVYAALGDLMETDIHALSIDARAPAERTDGGAG